MINSPQDQFTEAKEQPVDFRAIAQESVTPANTTSGMINSFVRTPPKENTFGEIVSAAFKTENIIGSFLNDRENAALRANMSTIPDPEFNAIKFAQPGDEQYLPWTINSQNEDEYYAKLFKVKDELEQRQIMEENPGTAFLAGFFANVVDPTILLPGGTVYKGAQASWSATKSALSIGLAAAASAGIQEVGLHSSQDVRTMRESAFNIITTGLIGSLIGGVAGNVYGGGLGKLAKSEIATTLDEGLPTPKPVTASRTAVARGLTTVELMPESVGAAKVDIDLIRQSSSFAGGFLANLAIKGVGFDTPMMILATDSFAVSKNIVALTTEHNMLMNKNLPVELGPITGEPINTGGQASTHAIETLINIDKGAFENAILDYHNTFLEYSGIKPGTFLAPERAALNKDGMTRPQFGRAVFDEIINPGMQGPVDPFVKKAAESLVNKVFEPMKKAFIEEGIFGPDVSVSTAARYFMRVYNKDLIKSAAGNARFKEAIRPWIVEQNELLKELMPLIETIEKDLAQARGLETRLKNKDKAIEEAGQAYGKSQEERRIILDEAGRELDALHAERNKARQEILDKESTEKNKVSEQINKDINEYHQTLHEAKRPWDMAQYELDEALKGNMKIAGKGEPQLIKNLREKVKNYKKYYEEVKASEDKNRAVAVEIDSARLRAIEIDRKQELLTNPKMKKLLKKIDSVIRRKEKTLKLEKEAKKEYERQKKYLEDTKPEEATSVVEKLEKELENIVPKDSPMRTSEGKIRRVLEDHEFDTVVDNTIDNILGRGEDSLLNPILTRLTGSKPSPMASRTFQIPDHLIADFLLTDPIDVVPMFTNATIPYLHMIRLSKALEQAYPMKPRKVKELGDSTIEYETPFTVDDGRMNLRAQLKEELDYRRLQAGDNEELVHKLEKDWERANKALDDTYDMLLGRYGMGPNVLDGKAAKVAKTINTWNFTRFMGFLGLSALPDLGAIALKNGVFRFLFDGMLPVFKTMKGDAFTKDLLQDMGLALNTYKGMLAKGGMGKEGLLTESGIFSKALNYAATRYGNATLANQWQDFTQFMAARVGLARTLRALDDFATTGKMAAKERTRLNALGIHEAEYKIIHDEWGRIGGKSEGSYWIDFTKWGEDTVEQTNALKSFKAAIYKEVNSTVLEAGGGIGDIPRFFRAPLGSVMFQFKKYFFQATNRLLIPAIQRGDAEAWQGAALMLTMGAMVWYTKGLIRGDEMDLSFENVAINAIDQSGLAAQYGVYYGVLSSFGLGIAPSRYNNVGQVGNVLGPAAGAFGDVAQFINIARDPDRNLTTKNYEKLIRLLPYQNYPPLYRASRALGRNIGLALGAEDSER